MPEIRVSFAAAALVLALVASATAQPANDDCTNATVITALPFTDPVDTTTATTEIGDPSCEGAEIPSLPVPEPNSVWYAYTPAADVLVTVDTSDSDSSDLVATVALGSCGALAILDCDPNLGYNDQRLTVPVAAGTTAFIEIVDASFGGGGDAVVHVTETLIGDGTPRHTGVDFQVNETVDDYERFPDVTASAAGDFVVVWAKQYGGAIHGRRFDAAATPLASEFVVTVHSTSSKAHPAIAPGGAGGFVVGWQSFDQPFEWDVIARRFDAAAAPLGGELQVNTHTTGRQAYPDVAAEPGGGFVVVWQSEAQDGSGSGIFGRRYDAAGVPAGDEFQVNTYTTFDQAYPAVGMAADGAFVVAWESDGQDGDREGVFARRYDAAGAPTGPEFQVNVATTFRQQDPVVAMRASGEFLIAWDDDSGDRVVGRLFDAAGAPETGELQVSRPASLDASDVTAGANADGDFIVAWTEYEYGVHPDVNGPRIVAQRLSSAGAKVGDEFQANTYATWAQERPTIGMAATGHFVVVWEDYTEYPGRDGLGPGIFGQRLTLPAVGATIGVRPTKLIAVDKTGIGAGAKVVYVSKDQAAGITKGTNEDPGTVSARFDLAYDSTAGAFVAPAGASAGTTGWKTNKLAVAKYVNTAASLAPGSAIKVTVLKTGTLIKVVAKSLGDGPMLDLVGAGAPVGPVASCYAVENGGERFRFGSTWAPGDCTVKEIAGGAGRKLVCKGGAGDATCAAAP